MHSTSQKKILKINNGELRIREDNLATEEPLEIQLAYWENNSLEKISLSITMRTPGEDEALALGFLYAEGIIDTMDQVVKIAHLPSWDEKFSENRIVVGLAKGVEVNLDRLQRHFFTNSSCGICGKASIDAIQNIRIPELLENEPKFEVDIIQQLPEQLRQEQSLFETTGGIHAAALFNTKGELQIIQEDIGRHNAVDKLIGTAFKEGLLPLDDYLILVSGRASFELVQKALMAQIPIMAAVGAPSNLAVELADNSGMTLIGFLKHNQMNVYCGSSRVVL